MILQVGVKTLVRNSSDAYLFIKRLRPLPTGEGICWDIPGGRIEPDDTSILEALRREVREETSLHIEGTPELLAAQDVPVTPADLHVVRLTYSVKTTGRVRLGSDHQAYLWLPLRDSLKLKTDPYLEKVLKQLAQSQ